MSSQVTNLPTQNNATPTIEYSGWLHKWTNYIHGYQKRYFRLKGDYINYYRNDSDTSPCRGKVRIDRCTLHVQSSTMFTIMSDHQQFTLRALNEIQRQHWINSIELARSQIKQRRKGQKNSNNNNKNQLPNSNQNNLIINNSNQKTGNRPSVSFKTNSKSSLITNNSELESDVGLSDIEGGLAAQDSSASDIENNNNFTSSSKNNNNNDKLTKCSAQTLKKTVRNLQKNVKNRTVFTQLANQLIYSAVEFERAVSNQLNEERKKRQDLEKQIEALAKQHVDLEAQLKLEKTKQKQLNQSLRANSESTVKGRTGTASGLASSFDDEDEFEDALSDGFDFDETDVGILKIEDQQENCENGNDSGVSKNQNSSEVECLSNGPILIAQKQEEKPVEQKTKTNSPFGLEPPYGTKDLVIVNRDRRKTINPRSNSTVNLWNLIKNFVGQDLSRIPMPVNFNEPLSMLQRISEGIEYHSLLDIAATKSESTEQMAYICAYMMSNFSNTRFRINKPFNPLLGETFEIDRFFEEAGFRLIVEQTSHHPPAASLMIQSRKGWIFWNHTTLTSKFRGNYLTVQPVGISHIYFPESGNHYTCDTITTTAHNIIVGKLWMDNSGNQTIINHKTKDYCVMKYHPYSYFSRDPPRRVTGVIMNGVKNQASYVLNGDWDSKLSMKKIIQGSLQNNSSKSTKKGKNSTPNYQTVGNQIMIWKKKTPSEDAIKRYHFTNLTFTLNQMELGIAPTDSRHRPDQKLMETGYWDEANEVKKLLEEAQRARRRERETAAKIALASGQEPPSYKATWFKKISEFTEEQQQNNLILKMTIQGNSEHKKLVHKNKILNGEESNSSNTEDNNSSSNNDSHNIVECHVYNDQYWMSKKSQNWLNKTAIFDIEGQTQNQKTLDMLSKMRQFMSSEAVEKSSLCN